MTSHNLHAEQEMREKVITRKVSQHNRTVLGGNSSSFSDLHSVSQIPEKHQVDNSSIHREKCYHSEKSLGGYSKL
jgi:hypothetical protein